MPLYRDAAVVLRTHPLGEADRIITLLGHQRGKVRAVAKGVRRTKSRFGARLEPAMVVDVQCYEGRSLDTITQAESLASYGEPIARDYSRWVCAQVMCETAESLLDEGEANPAQFRLLVGALSALAQPVWPADLLLAGYLSRALSIAGWPLVTSECAVCGAGGPHRAVHVASGGTVCPSCRRAGATAPHPESIALLDDLVRNDWGSVRAALGLPSAPARRREVQEIVLAHLQWHTERQVRSVRQLDLDDLLATDPTTSHPHPTPSGSTTGATA
ncbi:DNA replication and repair protein RecO [Kytococcus aerolatus]|uniref:DNA repair protein RecO n=1 Tax=Kytococcus aerolatus TaxID=592308 RepID=A0A212U2Q9_9MICO|nr:DNA repair protein RecO [Kytococcus aerolatus]SNC72404.1 DNA replication and repair protein RecO [Kytococcus aerolatus]